MKKIVLLILSIALLTAMLPMSVFAASQAEYTIDVRNRTGAPVEMSLRGADGVPQFVTIPVGISSLTILEGNYDYFASTNCGNISGVININQQRQTLRLDCDAATPNVSEKFLVKSLPSFACAGLPADSYIGVYDKSGYWVILTCAWTWDELMSQIVDPYLGGYNFLWSSFIPATELYGYCEGLVWYDDLYKELTGNTSPLGPLPTCVD